jgi:hypothetical protein
MPMPMHQDRKINKWTENKVSTLSFLTKNIECIYTQHRMLNTLTGCHVWHWEGSFRNPHSRDWRTKQLFRNSHSQDWMTKQLFRNPHSWYWRTKQLFRNPHSRDSRTKQLFRNCWDSILTDSCSFFCDVSWGLQLRSELVGYLATLVERFSKWNTTG